MDIANRTRKLVLQSAQEAEQQKNFRINYVRFLLVVALLGAAFLQRVFLPNSRPAFNIGDANLVYFIGGGYLLYSLIVMMASTTFAKRAGWLPRISLLGDVLLALATSWFIGLPVFGLAFVPAMLLGVFVGPLYGFISAAVVGAANVVYLLFGTPPRNLTSEDGLVMLLVFAAGAIFTLGLFVISQSRAPLTQTDPAWLEDVMSRSNSENLLELQNRVKAIYRVASTLNATLDYQKVVQNVLVEVKSVFDISVGAILIFEGTMNTLRVADDINLTEPEKLKAIDSRNQLIKDALSEARPILIEDEETMDDLRKVLPSFKNCVQAIIMPLRGGYEVYGLLIIGTEKHDNYHENDLEMMVALTAHTVVSMQNATLYRNLLEDRNKMINAEEEVRHTLARNLHDGPAQAVAAFSMQTEFIRRLFKSEPERAMEELAMLGKQSQQTSKEIRMLLYELRPLVLESQGLNAALEQYASRFPMAPTDPQVHFSANEDFSNRFSPAVETTIFTILQEAVNNARKHAQARNIWLNLTFKDGYIIASSQDDGRGFDVDAVKRSYDTRGSLGLTNMSERAALVGGTADILSRPGKGTTVVIRIPLTDATMAQPATGGGAYH